MISLITRSRIRTVLIFFHQDPYVIPQRNKQYIEKQPLPRNVKGGENIPQFTLKVNEVYSGLRPVLHPSFAGVRSVVFV